MYGILTSDVGLAREGVGDVTHFLADGVDGRRREPIPGAVNAVACWGDTGTVREEPERAAVAADGSRATPDAEGHHWGTVCPTDPDYRDPLLERIERVGDVRLTTLGFPGDAFCRCSRCEERFARSERTSREDWRADAITEFVAAAAARVDGDVLATLYPDPYPGNLRERAGLDPRALEPHVDGFLVPLCGDYGTPYWVESLARGFGAELGELDADVTVQLSADGADADRLEDVTRMVEPHGDAVVYGTFPDDAATVREVIRRRTEAAESRPVVAR
ncbi:hypothetical protein [Halovivax sp.]|uniref:hypothetical protein n=1 Tax=Halovivax sp. TaxID=1935978 RepID=UPI0025C43D61|nr:hypothetical protein [Halovivax sp.]